MPRDENKLKINILRNEHTFQQFSSMSDKIKLSLLTLSVELIYRIIDHMDDRTLFLTMTNVCTRLTTIIDTYHRYRVNFFILSMFYFHHLQNIIHSFLKYKSYLCSILSSNAMRYCETAFTRLYTSLRYIEVKRNCQSTFLWIIKKPRWSLGIDQCVFISTRVSSRTNYKVI
jgi:hypothetical protein